MYYLARSLSRAIGQLNKSERKRFFAIVAYLRCVEQLPENTLPERVIVKALLTYHQCKPLGRIEFWSKQALNYCRQPFVSNIKRLDLSIKRKTRELAQHQQHYRKRYLYELDALGIPLTLTVQPRDAQTETLTPIQSPSAFITALVNDLSPLFPDCERHAVVLTLIRLLKTHHNFKAELIPTKFRASRPQLIKLLKQYELHLRENDDAAFQNNRQRARWALSKFRGRYMRIETPSFEDYMAFYTTLCAEQQFMATLSKQLDLTVTESPHVNTLPVGDALYPQRDTLQHSIKEKLAAYQSSYEALYQASMQAQPLRRIQQRTFDALRRLAVH